MIRIWTFLVMVLPCVGFAQVFPEPNSAYVNDYANVLGQDAHARIEAVLADIYETQGVEATLVTMASKSDVVTGLSLEQFAMDLFNEWGIGDATRNDGVLLLYLDTDREVRIELGGAYGQDWNHWARIVVDDVLVPNFRAGRTEVGLIKGVESLRDEIVIPFINGEDAPQSFDDPENRGGADRRSLSEYIPFLFISLVVGLLGYNVFKGLDRFRTCPSCGKRGHIRTEQIADEGGYDPKYTTGIKITDCGNCGHHDEARYMHRKSSGGSGVSGRSGSSGGFGGGSSGGGGASGRW